MAETATWSRTDRIKLWVLILIHTGLLVGSGYAGLQGDKDARSVFLILLILWGIIAYIRLMHVYRKWSFLRLLRKVSTDIQKKEIKVSAPNGWFFEWHDTVHQSTWTFDSSSLPWGHQSLCFTFEMYPDPAVYRDGVEKYDEWIDNQITLVFPVYVDFVWSSHAAFEIICSLPLSGITSQMLHSLLDFRQQASEMDYSLPIYLKQKSASGDLFYSEYCRGRILRCVHLCGTEAEYYRQDSDVSLKEYSKELEAFLTRTSTYKVDVGELLSEEEFSAYYKS